MKLLTVLTVILVAMTGLAFAPLGEGTNVQQESLVTSYKRLVTKGNQFQKVVCPGVKSKIVIKRNRTWQWQDTIYVPRSPTRYTERGNSSCHYLNWMAGLWTGRARQHFHKSVQLREPRKAICYVFGAYCSQALRVAACESRYHITARNGQYLGLFQMGFSERSKYGHGYTALEQAHAAYQYFVASGKDWSPWSCKP